MASQHIAGPPADLRPPSNASKSAFARQVQALGYGWNGLSPGDVTRIVSVLEEAAECAPVPANLQRIESAFALAACLFTGRRLTQLAELRWTVLSAWPEQEEVAAGFVRCGHSYGWYLPAGRAGKPVEGSIHEDDRCLWLPAPPLVERLAALSFKARGLVASAGGALFSRASDLLESSCRSALRNPTIRRAGTTLEAVERWLFDAVRLAPAGDAALAQLLTTRSEITSATPSYYSSCTQAQIEELWWAAVNPVLGCDLSRAPHERLREQRYGSPFYPSDDLVVEVRNLLRERVAAADSIEDQHNALTLYTFTLCSLGLALRPANRSLLKRNGIDPATGLITIDDDRRRDPFMVRLSWAAPAVQEQLRLYERHLGKLARGRPDIALLIKRAGCDVPSFLFVEGLPQCQTLFEVMSNVSGVAPAPLKENFARHYIRSKLLGRCATETLQAFMGHWNSGTEPFGAGSGLDPLLYRADLMRALPPILEQAGWVPLGAQA